LNIEEALKEAIDKLNMNKVNESTLKARMLLAFVLDKEKEYLVIHNKDEVEERLLSPYFKYIDEVIEGKPIQYITKHQEFMGLDFYVNENVLIPQPDTESLVEEVIKLADIVRSRINPSENVKILDMCTGSGAIAVSLAEFIRKSEITAVDISKLALKVAEYNAAVHEKKIKFIASNLFEELNKNEKYHIIVANPPYIESDVIKLLPKEVQNEPIMALDGGRDGLYFYKEIARNAKRYLEKDGFLALEIGYNQRDTVGEIIASNAYKDIAVKKDLSLNDRIIIAHI
jgi:release factor glutamine methyltransferase